MNRFAVITPVPDLVTKIIQESIVRKSIENGLAQIDVVNLRNFAEGNYRQVDDAPFGGGDGMVMMAKPFFKAIDHTISEWKGCEKIEIVYHAHFVGRHDHSVLLGLLLTLEFGLLRSNP